MLFDSTITTISSIYTNMRTVTCPTIVIKRQQSQRGLLCCLVGGDDAARVARSAVTTLLALIALLALWPDAKLGLAAAQTERSLLCVCYCCCAAVLLFGVVAEINLQRRRCSTLARLQHDYVAVPSRTLVLIPIYYKARCLTKQGLFTSCRRSRSRDTLLV
jgi:hypothetical protein